MNERPYKVRRGLAAVALLGATAALVLTFLVAAAQGGSDTGISAYVVATNKGPLPACADDRSDCGDENVVWHFLHVRNLQPLTNANGATVRTTVPNSFVIASVDMAVFVDGAPHPQFPPIHWVPPPNTEPPGFHPYSGHWPATVLCSGGPPCTEVTSPAILPGENTVGFYTGWAHGESEPDGVYVFKFTVHGTLNGVPTDVVANSPKISMTR